MAHSFRRFAAALIAACWLLPSAAGAQAPQASGAAYSQDQLDSLLAPVALYPDQLLAQVLMASTYPLDIVSAARFVAANPGLEGDALDQAVTGQAWDPSVQSLTAFPQVLDMMNQKLDWTQQLGDAYLTDQASVMRTVQELRAKAQAAGNLKTTEQQKIVVQEKTIIIEPAQPAVVYVPVYNPTFVYGPWWAPAYPPYYWPPPPMYYPGGALVAGAIGFGVGWAIGANHWGWCNTNWRGGDININVNRNNTFINNNVNYRNNVNNGNWQHNPAQRKGVAYNNAATRDRYQKIDSSAVAARRDYRGASPSQGGLGASAARPSTMDRPGAGSGARPSTMDRPGGGAGAQGPSTRDLPGSGQRPSAGTMERPSAGSYDRSAGSTSRQSPSFNSAQSRSQAQQYSSRGAASRASMPSGGGGARAGGGGGGGARAGGGGGGGARAGGGGGGGARAGGGGGGGRGR